MVSREGAGSRQEVISREGVGSRQEVDRREGAGSRQEVDSREGAGSRQEVVSREGAGSRQEVVSREGVGYCCRRRLCNIRQAMTILQTMGGSWNILNLAVSIPNACSTTLHPLLSL